MKVVRVNDFDIPSDENDYDELVAFADTMASIEQFEAIPKADYENRLKADMVAILTEIQLEIEELPTNRMAITDSSGLICYGYSEYEPSAKDASKLIQEKIDSLRGEENHDKV